MPTDVAELVFTTVSIGKLGGRSISDAEVGDMPWNRYRVIHDPAGRDKDRRLMIGQTNGGRYLTVVIEPTSDMTTWVVVTGWESTKRERKMLTK